ncbi:MAG: hypothetical protein ABS46_17780 [Cytophagaceae bacterium SCN 52-12]|nr:MAG: hypothetical protein ABS46_17780 [Cytophagaceae bacterium SCN 52-12]
MKFSAGTFFLAVLIVLIILYLKYCSEDKPSSPIKDPAYAGYSIRLNGMSLSELKDTLQNGLGITIKPEDLYACPCDSSLVNLKLTGVTIEGHGPVRVRTGTDAVGLDIEYGKNYLLVSNTDSLPRDFIGSWLSALKDSTTGSVKEGRLNPYSLTPGERVPGTVANLVAIFDSGIHPDLNIPHYANVLGVDSTYKDRLCDSGISVATGPQKRIFGINHMHEEGGGPIDYSHIWDHTLNLHGTKVTQLLASQRINQPSAPLRVLTMRVLNNDNKGDLFSLMCAMSQAKKMGARIFNMSLGYYGPVDTLFEEHMEQLAADKIWVVTAAGNAVDGFDSGDSNLPENRDLALRPVESRFYPAYFSKNMQHVIAVTSVSGSPDQTCDLQNYGKEVVDVGVMADDCHFRFMGGTEQVSVSGTSYAAPVVTGWLARKKDLDTFANKADLLSDAPDTTALSDRVKGGKYIRANGY